jgi:hypothetical protein
MRARFDSAYIRSELERIGQHLDNPLTVFLIGGGSMAFRGLKETTKDIDLIVSSGDDLSQLRKFKEKAPPLRAGMNPTLPITNHVRWNRRIFHVRIHIFK